ncbi:MAG: hypothetical protein OEM04_01945 [Flavobacteriaceae bacterium]|nr:hypothetical protein [Flavobacteriaceae bacterium]
MMRLLYLMVLSVVLLASCNKKKDEYKSLSNNASVHQVKVKEVIQGGTYTFILANENDRDFWMAVGKTEVKADDVVYYQNALIMKDFESKELDRTFDEILFVQEISKSPEMPVSKVKDSLVHKRKEALQAKDTIQVDPAPGGITIGELFKNRSKYENKKVLIRGQVIKVNSAIMDRNWVHLKDGTSNDGKSDMTFTTLEEVKVGEIVTLEGTVALDKEYGAGYVYPLVVEGATLK